MSEDYLGRNNKHRNKYTGSERRGKFFLDQENGWFLGVCAGVANTLGVDAALVRVGTIVTGLFMPKIVIAVYLVAWLVLDNRTGFTGKS